MFSNFLKNGIRQEHDHEILLKLLKNAVLYILRMKNIDAIYK